MLEFETRGRYSNAESSLDIQIGNIFYGTEGYLELKGRVHGKLSVKGKKNLLPVQKPSGVHKKQIPLQELKVQIILPISLMQYVQVKTRP